MKSKKPPALPENSTTRDLARWLEAQREGPPPSPLRSLYNRPPNFGAARIGRFAAIACQNRG